MATIEERLTALEAAVARWEEAAAEATPSPERSPDFWMLEGLEQRHPEGVVAYAGHAALAAGPVRWQVGAPVEPLLGADWAEVAARLDALAHPVRLRLAQLALQGTETTAELAADADLGTTGQLHHHLRQLVAAGWLQSAGRGRYRVPAQRVVPLLAIVAAARD